MHLYPRPQTVELFDQYISSIPSPPTKYLRNIQLSMQEYMISILPDGITLEFSSEQGKYYAELTLQQMLIQQPDKVRCCVIHDRPDFENRCVMIDLGRNHVPTLENLCRLVDMLSKVKINQLQLYFEGFPFAYSSHPQVWKNRDVLTAEEIRTLDQYCRDHFVELVPTLNAFGHMKHWLARDEYHDLGIQPKDPNGYRMPWGYEKGISTLDPEKPGSWELTKSLFDDLLPCFTSNKVNICCDETFELQEKKKDGKDPEKLYFDYLIKIYSHIKNQYPEKKMLFWGDIIEQHPQYIERLPEDLTPILWRYEKNQPSLETCQIYQKTGKQYYVAASTSTHATIVGDTETMLSNTNCCTKNGSQAGAVGFIMTKWQDLGGWDETCVSYPGLIYGAVQSWNVHHQHDTEMYLNRFVYMDESNQMAQIAMELGNFRNFEHGCEHYNGNGILRLLYYYQLCDEDHDLDFLRLPAYAPDFFDRVKSHVLKYQNMLESAELHCNDAALIKDEYRLLIRLLLHGVALGKYRQQGRSDRAGLWELYDDIQTIIADYRKGWLLRNKNINIENSVYKLYELQRQYQQRLGVERIKV